MISKTLFNGLMQSLKLVVHHGVQPVRIKRDQLERISKHKLAQTKTHSAGDKAHILITMATSTELQADSIISYWAVQDS